MTEFRRRVAAVSGAGAMIAALGGIVVAIALAPWFSLTANALSDLGVADRTAVATAFNGGLLLGGAVAIAYAWALWAAARTLGARVVAVEFAAAATLMAGVGAFPSGTSLHFPVALGFYLALTLVLATDGAVRRTTTAGRLALAAAGVHLWQWWLWVAGVRLGPGLAIPELVGALLLAAWVLAGSPVAPLARVARDLTRPPE
ncbi:DUF998 domain-containing protein [Halobaculum sp. WSA2]|uniref:DUF998 domain-containing protein n=1 Tax=Halobaculum saliterrae TaxID=2073113 RepID=A0A6B0STK5_9EURY|nr:DUF998 domain-containing protein [Halobaculum saliterrae]MXR42025.1 DUF998 domain-containing protein [Halobaculum saliterrae]